MKKLEKKTMPLSVKLRDAVERRPRIAGYLASPRRIAFNACSTECFGTIRNWTDKETGVPTFRDHALLFEHDLFRKTGTQPFGIML